MQSHNGDIELNVTLNTKGVESDAKKIKNEIEKALSKTDVTSGKKTTEEYQALENELARCDKMLEKLVQKQIDMQIQGKDSSKAFESTDQQIESINSYMNAVRKQMDELVQSGRAYEEVSESVGDEWIKVGNILTKNKEYAEQLRAEEIAASTKPEEMAQNIVENNVPSMQYPTLTLENLEEETAKIYAELEGTKEEFNDVDNSAKRVVEDVEKFKLAMRDTTGLAENLARDLQVFDQGFRYSDEFVELKKTSDSLTKQFNTITAKMHEMELLGESGSEKYQEMANKAILIADTLRDVNGQMTSMRETGKAYTEGIDETEYRNVETQYNVLADKLSLMRHEQERASESTDRATRITNAYSRSMQSLSKGLVKVVGSGLSIIPSIFNRLTRSLRDTEKQVNKVGKGFKRILMYTLGIRGVYSLFRKIRTALKEGIKNLAKWREGNNQTNESLSTLTSSLTYLKNAWGAAFSPIIAYVTPALDKLIQSLAEAANALSFMFAKLTGQSTWMKAIRVQKDYAKSLSGTGSAAKEATEKLAQYDKLVVISQDNAGGASSANADIDNMFEEVSIDDAVDWVDDFLEKVKQAWEKADFTDIGNIIGEWLKNALDNVSWKEIQAFAKKLAHSIATLLNGFFETEGLGTTIGKTIAETLKTAFMFVNEFVHTLHWDSVGRFIADALLAIFGDEELFKEAGEAVGGAIRGFIDLIWAALEEFTENDGFTQIGQRIADFVNSALEELNRVDEDGLSGWEKLGQSISMSVEGLLDTISTALAETDWRSLANGIVQVLENIDWLEILDQLNNVASNLLKAIAEAIKGITDEGVKGTLATAIALLIAGLVITVDTVTLIILAATVILGFDIGKLIGEALFPEDAVWYEEFDWSEFFNENELNDILDGIGLMITTWSDDTFFWWGVQIKERWNAFVAFLDDCAFWFRDILDGIGLMIKEIWNKFVAFLDDCAFWFRDILESLKDLLKKLKDDIIFWWSEIAEMLSTWLDDLMFWWNDILEGVKGFLSDCLFWIDDFFNNTLEYAENFGGDLELVLNNIIGFIEKVINSAIDGINALLSAIGSIDLDFSGLPAAIQDKIGTGISFDLPTLSHVSIPRLAQGAVIPPNKEFLAMLGDQNQGVNIETPLETMMEAFRAVLEENRNNEPIVLQLNGKVIAQAVWDEERKKYKQTGSYAY